MILSSLTTGQRFSAMGWIQSYRLTVAFLFSVITALILSERFTKHPPRLLVWSFAFFLSRVLAKGVIQGGSRDDILTVLDGKHSSMTRWECVVNLKAQYLHRHFWTRHPSLTPTILNGNQWPVFSIIMHGVFISERFEFIPGGNITPSWSVFICAFNE